MPNKAPKKKWDFKYVDTGEPGKNFEPVSGLTTFSLEHYNADDRQLIREIAQKQFDRMAEEHYIGYGTKRYFLHTTEDEEYFGKDSVFGVNLQNLLRSDQEIEPSCSMPLVLEMLLKSLDHHGYNTDGMMSLAPNANLLKEVKSMMATDFHGKGMAIKRLLTESPVHLTENILKFFFQCVPGSIFTREFSDAFLKLSSGVQNKYDRLKAMKLLIFQLPDVNANALHDFLLRLQNIAKNEERTKMNAAALSRVITPCLFYIRQDQEDLEGRQLEHSPPFDLTLMLIDNVDILFTVPPFIVKAFDKKKRFRIPTGKSIRHAFRKLRR